ncbi:MAG: hypothetical protein EBT21_03220 [Actinobacteria bacterium]|nr:hypothetical protein [Actinomycetota bacterium]
MHGKRALLFIIGGVVFALILVFSAWIVLGKFRPELEIQRMLKAMSQVQTVRERSAFSWTRGEGRERTTTTLYVTGQADLSQPDALQHDSKFRLFRLSKATDYADLSGEIRLIDGTTYLTYAAPGPDVTGVEFSKSGTWVSFLSGELPEWGSVIPGLNAPVASVTPAGSEWNGDGLVRLRDLLGRADVFLVRYDDVTEVIDGHAARIIDARFDPDALRSFLLDIVRAKVDRDPTTDERLAVENEALTVENVSIRLWIGIDDHRLYRIQAAGGLYPAGPKVLVPADAIVELYDFDAPFGAVAPETRLVTSFASILSALPVGDEGPLSNGSEMTTLVSNDAARLPTQTTDANGDTDGDGLSAIVEAFYLTDPNKADTDGDGKSDGEEVLSGQNPRGNGTLFGFGLGQ